MSKAAIYIIMALMLMSIALAATPTIDNLYIEPPQALNNDTLTNICNASDADLDPVSYEYYWWVNDVSTDTSLTIPSTRTLKMISASGYLNSLVRCTSGSFTVGDVENPRYDPSISTYCNTGICGINYRIQMCGYTYQRSVGIFHSNYAANAWSSSGSEPISVPESCLDVNRAFTVTLCAQFATIDSFPRAYVQAVGGVTYTATPSTDNQLYSYNFNTYDNVTTQCVATAGGESVAQNFTTTILSEIPACSPNWVCDTYDACDTEDEQKCIAASDSNLCGESYTGDYTEFTPMTCDYCIPEAVNNTPSAWSDVGVCLITDEQEQERTITDYDNNSCYATTGLATDIFTPTIYTETQYDTCDYCTPAPTNTSWSSWVNTGVCLANDTQEQTRSLTEYDSNSCYATTGLPADNFIETTYNETQYDTCDYCTPDWTCTGYEECVNVEPTASCNQVNDTNLCGESYTGNYSEFTPQECTYTSGSSGGTSWPETTEEEQLIFSTNIEPENETGSTTLSILNIGGSSNIFSSFSKDKADEFFEQKIKPNAWLIGIILLMTMSISGIAINKSNKKKPKRKKK